MKPTSCQQIKCSVWLLHHFGISMRVQRGCRLARWRLAGEWQQIFSFISSLDTLITRWLNLAYPALSKEAFKRHINVLAVFGIWLYALLMVIPISFGIFGTFEYNPCSGKCDYIDRDDERYYWFSIEFGLPCILIVASYTGIWKVARRSTRRVSLFLWVYI